MRTRRSTKSSGLFRSEAPLTRRFAPPSPSFAGRGTTSLGDDVARGRRRSVVLLPACGEKVPEGRIRGPLLRRRSSLQRIDEGLQLRPRERLILEVAAEEVSDLLDSGEDVRGRIAGHDSAASLLAALGCRGHLRRPLLQLAGQCEERFIFSGFQESAID